MDKKYTIAFSHPIREQLAAVVTSLPDFVVDELSASSIKKNTAEWKSLKMFSNFNNYINFSSVSKISIQERIQKIFGLVNIKIYRTEKDMVFSNGGFLITNKPYVIYMEKATQIFGYTAKNYNKPIGRLMLKNRLGDNNLKYVFFRTETAMSGFLNTFKNDDKIVNLIKQKGRFVYPPTPKFIEPDLERFRNIDTFSFLFVSSAFILKGGKELVNAFNRLCEEFDNVELNLITKLGTIDDETLPKIVSNNKIKLHEPVNRKDLYVDFLIKSHCFVYPTYSDSFSMVINEAISMYLPIITSNFYSIPERVSDGVNGFLFESPFKNYDEKFVIFEEHFSDNNNIIREIYERSNDGKLKYVEDFLYEKMKYLLENKEKAFNLAEGSKRIYLEKMNSDLIIKNTNDLLLKSLSFSGDKPENRIHPSLSE